MTPPGFYQWHQRFFSRLPLLDEYPRAGGCAYSIRRTSSAEKAGLQGPRHVGKLACSEGFNKTDLILPRHPPLQQSRGIRVHVS